MAKSAKKRNVILPEFQTFLRDRHLAPEKNIPFLSYWASRFLSIARRQDSAFEDYLAALYGSDNI